MSKQELQEQIESIDYTCNSISHTIEYLQSCLLALLTEKEHLTFELNKLSNTKSTLWFKQYKDEKTQT